MVALFKYVKSSLFVVGVLKSQNVFYTKVKSCLIIYQSQVMIYQSKFAEHIQENEICFTTKMTSWLVFQSHHFDIFMGSILVLLTKL